MKTLLAVLAAAAALSASRAAAEPAGEGKDPPLPGYTESSRRKHPAPERRPAAPSEEPSRARPARPFPGDVPEKTTTSGSLDREGRVLREEQRAAPPPPPPPPPSPLGEEPHSAPPPR